MVVVSQFMDPWGFFLGSNFRCYTALDLECHSCGNASLDHIVTELSQLTGLRERVDAYEGIDFKRVFFCMGFQCIVCCY